MKNRLKNRLVSILLVLVLVLSLFAPAALAGISAGDWQPALSSISSAPAIASAPALSSMPAMSSAPALSSAPAISLQVTQDPDVPSDWAEHDVFMAYVAYKLGDASVYSGFKGGFTGEKFAPVIWSIANTFDLASGFLPHPRQMTRGDVVRALCNLSDSKAAAEAKTAIEFFVREGLLRGREDGDYALDNLCTVEEMLVFSVRTYDYLAYKNGKDSKGFCWKASGGVNDVYLLGSIHFSDGSMYPLSKNIEGAFEGAGFVVVEADMFNVSTLDQIYMLTRGMIQPESGKTIRDLISPETYALYVKAFESLGIPAENYDRFKPWFANSFLQVQLMTADASESLLGLDMYFLRKAYSSGKDVLELEGAAFQFDVFDSMSPRLQEAQLRSTLEAMFPANDGDVPGDIDESAFRDSFLYSLEVVKNGDEVALGEMLGVGIKLTNPLDIEFNKVFLVDRNIGMARKIDGYLKDANNKGDYFVIAGAAHMLGDEGVIALLSKMGYKISRI